MKYLSAVTNNRCSTVDIEINLEDKSIAVHICCSVTISTSAKLHDITIGTAIAPASMSDNAKQARQRFVFVLRNAFLLYRKMTTEFANTIAAPSSPKQMKTEMCVSGKDDSARITDLLEVVWLKFQDEMPR